MTPLKMVLSLLVLVMPGGSLVLFAVALMRAFRSARERQLARVTVPARRLLPAVALRRR